MCRVCISLIWAAPTGNAGSVTLYRVPKPATRPSPAGRRPRVSAHSGCDRCRVSSGWHGQCLLSEFRSHCALSACREGPIATKGSTQSLRCTRQRDPITRSRHWRWFNGRIMSAAGYSCHRSATCARRNWPTGHNVVSMLSKLLTKSPLRLLDGLYHRLRIHFTASDLQWCRNGGTSRSISRSS